MRTTLAFLADYPVTGDWMLPDPDILSVIILISCFMVGVIVAYISGFSFDARRYFRRPQFSCSAIAEVSRRASAASFSRGPGGRRKRRSAYGFRSRMVIAPDECRTFYRQYPSHGSTLSSVPGDDPKTY